ncbi:MAG: tetratricopeptide repeat protein [Thermoplasmatota archaeon]
MDLRPTLPALAILACVALPSAAASGSGFTATAVTGMGSFTLQLDRATWAASPPPGPGWHLEAAGIHVSLVDDKRTNRVPLPNPLNPSTELYSQANHTKVDQDFTSATLDIVGGQGDAIVLGLGGGLPVPLRSYGGLSIVPMEAAVIERSHATSNPSSRHYYEYPHGSGPAVTLGLTDLPAGNGTRLYAWGANLTLRDASGATQVIRTGSWADGPAGSGDVHAAYALIDLEGVKAPLRVQQATAYATGLALAGEGPLVFHAARGSLSDRAGTLHLDGDATVPGGEFRLSLDGDGLLATTTQALQAFTGAVTWQPRPFPWLPASLAAAGVAVALYALPTVRGVLLLRNGPRAARHLRSEAYAHWASRAQLHDRLRLAVWLEGRAVHNAPTVGEFRTERAILLRQAGRLDDALEEHRRAHDLLAVGPDGGYLALNAFQAALAGAEAGRDSEALRWLQAAIEADRGLVTEARSHPTLLRLRSHPDYGAVTA